MKRHAPWIVALCVVGLLGVAFSEDEADPATDNTGRARPVSPDSFARNRIGTWVDDLGFEDVEGRKGKLSSYADKKALVIAFHNLTCPVCKRYAPRLAQLEARFADRGVAFLFVNVSANDAAADIRAWADKLGWKGRVVHDPGGASGTSVRDVLDPQTTAEVFVLDAARTLVFRGAVDDQYGVGFVRDAPAARYLRDALDAVLTGRRPQVEATSAPGCVLTSGFAGSVPSSFQPTYHEHVERVLQRRCQQCHRPGTAAPFALTDYKTVKDNAAMIQWVVKEKRMPPWNAGAQSLPMANDGHLTSKEQEILSAWVNAGAPKGDPKRAPRPVTWPEGWQIGTPDVVLEIPRTQHIPAEGVLRYRNVTVPTDFGEDKWIAAYEIRPTAPQVVHHVLVFARYPREHPRAHEQPRVRNGIDGYFAAMVPGQTAYRFPPGTGRFLPRGTRLRFQLHYTPDGTATADRTRLGLVFTSKPPTHEVRSLGVHNTRLRIPPNAENHRVASAKVLHRRARLLGFTPHMHLRGKSFRFELERPGGQRQVLVDVPRYDFNWQFHYALREPLDVPAGSRIHVVAHYDNSKDNPFNPDPTQTVRWGDQTFDEMLIGYVEWHPAPK